MIRRPAARRTAREWTTRTAAATRQAAAPPPATTPRSESARSTSDQRPFRSPTDRTRTRARGSECPTHYRRGYHSGRGLTGPAVVASMVTGGLGAEHDPSAFHEQRCHQQLL